VHRQAPAGASPSFFIAALEKRRKGNRKDVSKP